MSGIYGMVRYDGAPVTRETLAPMAAAMAFWGPDGHGQWCGEGAGLGHLMLHVTPESLHERLPATIRVAPHLVITADARIDNRDELFDALGVPGPGRDQTPDSSLILLAYERWGPDCVKRLLGDFAFAVWDSRERKLFCARDLFGCKPFVYHHDGKRFIFASDVKGVLARVESPQLNEPLLATYLQMPTFHAEKRLTFFEEIVKLPPAHWLSLTAGGVQMSRYWSPEDVHEVRLKTDDDYAAQMRFLFEESVKCRLRSAFPIGSHLSGGLDSSAISISAARALRVRGQQLAVFSWSPQPSPEARHAPEDEHTRIDAVCGQEGLSCQYVPTTRNDYMEAFRRDFTTEPVSMLIRETGVQRRAASQQLRVLLSGWGGDEAVSAHTTSYFTEFLINNQWSEFQSALLLRLKGADQRSGRNFARNVRIVLGILRQVTVACLPDSYYAMIHKNAFLEHRNACIQPAFRRLYQHEVKRLRGPIWRQLTGVRATICRHLDLGFTTQRLEHWTASGARLGLVYRYPMLDRRLVDFVLGVPALQFRGPDHKRTLFRRAVGEMLPASGVWRLAKSEPTVGAPKEACFGAHSDWAHHLVTERGESSARRFVDPSRLQPAILSAIRSGRLVDLSGVREAFGCYAIAALR